MAKKYDPSTSYLRNQPPGTVSIDLSFAEIEAILGQSLPPAARAYRPWWGNETNPGRSQSAAWQTAGWKVARVDLPGETVAFARGDR